MPVSAGSGKHEPSQPRDRPQQQPKLPSVPPSSHPLSPPLSLPLSLPLLIYSRPAQPLPRHRFSTSREDSSWSPHADICRAPAGPMEEPQGNTLVVRIGIPDLQQTSDCG
ncbi:putative SH3 and multiple ankyrin repeat domains protein 3 [Triplophysa rosa]|uniref:SH3 and multiple ankyrin repeat domains protein 3 n=1 Tax=Triplophysa rosa TaxID=992332 RepID=A0A9W7TTB8_TRIRA|nr:putative SH3 and multiple ankyrin repeat domains protein 3 [Triplophysa rosa]